MSDKNDQSKCEGDEDHHRANPHECDHVKRFRKIQQKEKNKDHDKKDDLQTQDGTPISYVQSMITKVKDRLKKTFDAHKANKKGSGSSTADAPEEKNEKKSETGEGSAISSFFGRVKDHMSRFVEKEEKKVDESKEPVVAESDANKPTDGKPNENPVNEPDKEGETKEEPEWSVKSMLASIKDHIYGPEKEKEPEIPPVDDKKPNVDEWKDSPCEKDCKEEPKKSSTVYEILAGLFGQKDVEEDKTEKKPDPEDASEEEPKKSSTVYEKLAGLFGQKEPDKEEDKVEKAPEPKTSE